MTVGFESLGLGRVPFIVGLEYRRAAFESWNPGACCWAMAMASKF